MNCSSAHVYQLPPEKPVPSALRCWRCALLRAQPWLSVHLNFFTSVWVHTRVRARERFFNILFSLQSLRTNFSLLHMFQIKDPSTGDKRNATRGPPPAPMNCTRPRCMQWLNFHGSFMGFFYKILLTHTFSSGGSDSLFSFRYSMCVQDAFGPLLPHFFLNV